MYLTKPVKWDSPDSVFKHSKMQLSTFLIPCVLRTSVTFCTARCVNVDTNGDMNGINVSGCAVCDWLF